MAEEKESFVFYKSFYEALQDLKESERLKIYDAICELALNNNETKLTGISKTIFKLIKPQIVANNLRYENGKKGGRPKKETIGFKNVKPKEIEKEEKTKTETKPNVNDNENVNVNVNVNDNENKNENDVVLFFVEKYKETGFVKLEDKMKFLREIKSEEKYKELSEKDEHDLTDYVLKN